MNHHLLQALLRIVIIAMGQAVKAARKPYRFLRVGTVHEVVIPG